MSFFRSAGEKTTYTKNSTVCVSPMYVTFVVKNRDKLQGSVYHVIFTEKILEHAGSVSEAPTLAGRRADAADFCVDRSSTGKPADHQRLHRYSNSEQGFSGTHPVGAGISGGVTGVARSQRPCGLRWRGYRLAIYQS